jgi:hypothetical protein
MRKVSDKMYRENQNTKFTFRKPFFLNLDVYGIKRGEKYCTVRQATGDNAAPRIACWIDKATNTHTQNV